MGIITDVWKRGFAENRLKRPFVTIVLAIVTAQLLMLSETGKNQNLKIEFDYLILAFKKAMADL
jgi:hypothetical protein